MFRLLYKDIAEMRLRRKEAMKLDCCYKDIKTTFAMEVMRKGSCQDLQFQGSDAVGSTIKLDHNFPEHSVATPPNHENPRAIAHAGSEAYPFRYILLLIIYSSCKGQMKWWQR